MGRTRVDVLFGGLLARGGGHAGDGRGAVSDAVAGPGAHHANPGARRWYIGHRHFEAEDAVLYCGAGGFYRDLAAEFAHSGRYVGPAKEQEYLFTA